MEDVGVVIREHPKTARAAITLKPYGVVASER